MDILKEIRKWWPDHPKSGTNKRLNSATHGFKVLFDGPSPAAKILAAGILAREFKKELHPIDPGR